MKFHRFNSLFLYPFIVLFLIFSVFGVQKTNAASPSSILVNVSPQYPAPYENVNIDLNSYANNLDSVSITWYLNDKISSSGIGKKSFSLKAPAGGVETKVVANIALPSGDIETKIIIRPAVMELLWQANDSYVPPFYKGKALPSLESEIKVVAMPEIKDSKNKLVNSKNMTYSWQKDYTNDVGGSGYGKNFFLYTGDYLDESNTISVTASTVDQNYSSQNEITINETSPKIDFYKNDKILGTIWDKTIEDNYQITKSETIQAVPYFMSPKELDHPLLKWSWFINDNIINMPIFHKNFIPLKIDGSTHGTSKVRLELRESDKIFEKAEKEINVQF